MNIDQFLSRLGKFQAYGRNSWRCRCPAHDDRNPSLSVKVEDDGRILFRCRAGCAQNEVIDALGLTFSDLFPERLTNDRLPPVRHPFPAHLVLACLEYQGLVIVQLSNVVRSGQPLSESEHARLVEAVSHFQTAW